MRHYCTLFDHNYLAKGVVLYESLLEHSSEPFKLHILAMDVSTFWLLQEMDLKHASIMPISAFGSILGLDALRATRSNAEWFWTCGSQLLSLMMRDDTREMSTYLDADICFFSDPKVIFEEIGSRSLGIVPHRFHERDRPRLAANGEFNVGVVVARHDAIGRACIDRWAAQVRERCSAEVGCGDQQYLDEWPSLYGAACCVIENIGVDLGPWSLGNFSINQMGESAFWRVAVNSTPLVCYHFHEYIHGKRLTDWPVREQDKAIYFHYIGENVVAEHRIEMAKKSIGEHRLKMQAEAERA